MDIEGDVARHYTHGALEAAILDALRASGKDVDRLSADDLSAADEFHLGWRAATVELALDLALSPGLEVLDVGSGIGGPARYFAQAHGCRVTGIDLTEEFVHVATVLTRRCGLDHLATFVQGSGLALPFPSECFDRATLIHVGMNIPDKGPLFAEVLRVLRPGGIFCAYEIMRTDASELPFPMPWAGREAMSFVETPDTYRRLLAAAGFVIEREVNRRDQVLELGRAMRSHAARHGVPPLGLHVLMGPASRERLGNVMSALERGSIAPLEMLARKP
jgi:SAM-dependent methyltransferase